MVTSLLIDSGAVSVMLAPSVIVVSEPASAASSCASVVTPQVRGLVLHPKQHLHIGRDIPTLR